MNRKGFFKALGLGALVGIVAPKLLAKEKHSDWRHPTKEEMESLRTGYITNYVAEDDGVYITYDRETGGWTTNEELKVKELV